MRFYWIQEESSGVLEFDKISSYPAGSAEESQSSANFNEKPQILHAANASSFCSDKIFFVLDKTEIVQDKNFVQG